MSEPENQSPDASELEELKEQCAALRSQMTALLLALVVVSGTLSAYLFVQAHRARNDLKEFKPQATPIIEASTRDEPIIRYFAARLADYGRTHPDFVPILKKYGIPVTNTTAAPKPAPATKK